jgi:hypothetical protein
MAISDLHRPRLEPVLNLRGNMGPAKPTLVAFACILFLIEAPFAALVAASHSRN